MDSRRFNRKQRTALYLASDGRCALCGVELEQGWHADHEHPRVHGGPTDVINGQALCPTCNLKKGKKIQMRERRPLRKWQQEALVIYDQHQEKAFLLEACPAAGKSRFIAEVVQREINKEKASAILIVVPSAALRIQMALDFHEETGIQLDPKWNGNGVPLAHDGFMGAVVTYQWLSSNAQLARNKVSRQITLAVLDEVHHAQDEKSWGEALRVALEPATRILLTTGTPFTTNGNKISFVNYDEQGLSIPDYAYNYGMALTDGVVRTIFFNHHQGEMTWDSEDGTQKATFDDKLSKRDIGRRLRTALHEDHEHIGVLLKEGFLKLRELREDDPDAAMLVVAKDQDHAKKLAKRMQKEFGINPIVAVSEDGDVASGAIKSFKHSGEQCIIAVNMISEGVNIPRIRVVVYATNVTTFLYFMQVLGRAMRTEADHDDPTAWIFIPADKRFHVFADKLMKECEEALIKREKREAPSTSVDIDQDTIWFNPLSASFSNVIATVNGISIDANELAIAATFKTSNPALKGTGFSKEHIATMMKVLGFDFHAARQSNIQEQHSPSEDQVKPEKPLYERISDLKKENHKIAGSLHYRLSIEHKDINYRLNSAVGISSIQKCSDLNKLQRRYDLARRWMTKNTGPEEPFND